MAFAFWSSICVRRVVWGNPIWLRPVSLFPFRVHSFVNNLNRFDGHSYAIHIMAVRIRSRFNGRPMCEAGSSCLLPQSNSYVEEDGFYA